MTGNALTDLYQWAQTHLDKPVMARYQLYKVNGQTANKVSLLLRHIVSLRANAEIDVLYVATQRLPYQVVFTLLPANDGYPCPSELSPAFATQPDIIYWIKTGRKRGI